ncbi:MAG: hypothetical protein M3144_01310 [Actinomycetota bacterium]|nr:hypothetical protein [Actinomycetota bacterium]
MSEHGSGFDAPEDEKLLNQLREAGRLDPVPSEAVAAARSIFAWRTMDEELAALTYDSLLDDRALVGIRSAEPPPRLLTFEAPALTVEVETAASGDRRRLVGQLVPSQAARLEVRHSEGTTTAVADELGRFAVDDLPAGPISLHVQGSGDTAVAVTTDWVLV